MPSPARNPAPENRAAGKVLVVLLRGINVGGRHKLPMALLRQTCEALGCTEVATYIQSGNVVLRSSTPPDRLATELENALEKAVGFTPRVVTRSAEELARVLGANPYPEADPAKLLIGFLTGRPSMAAVKALEEVDVSPEAFTVLGSEIYLHYIDGVGTSKKLAKLPAQRLGVDVTARNLRTVNKLLEMSRAL
ncbi:MAG: DUF1697 domain-containing protein [Nocardioidaceae bacterium]